MSLDVNKKLLVNSNKLTNYDWLKRDVREMSVQIQGGFRPRLVTYQNLDK